MRAGVFACLPNPPLFFLPPYPLPLSTPATQYKNSKFASNYKANPIGFETQISLRR